MRSLSKVRPLAAPRELRVEHTLPPFVFVPCVSRLIEASFTEKVLDGDGDGVLTHHPMPVYAVSSLPMKPGRYVLREWPPIAVMATGFTVYAMRTEEDDEETERYSVVRTKAALEDRQPSAYAVVPQGGRVLTTAHSVISVQHKSGTLSLHRPSALLNRSQISGDSGVKTLFNVPPLTLVRCSGIYSAAFAPFVTESQEGLLYV